MLTLKYLRYWHTRFNKQCFGAKLTKPVFEILPVGEVQLDALSVYGLCWPESPTRIQVEAFTDLHLARRVLLHEMIHQWQHENHMPLNHGAAFNRKADQCFDLTGLSPVFS